MITIVKFGGTSIKDEKRLNLAAQNLIALANAGRQVLAVVSAQGNVTNELIEKASTIAEGQNTSKEYFQYLASGERMSALLLAMALKDKGQPAEPITHENAKFPLVSMLSFSGKESTGTDKSNELKHLVIDEDATNKRIKKFIKPLLDQNIIPVIAGFFITDADNNLISLGRGGSDVTSFLLGKYINCSEVIIVTDVKGVFSSDPRHVSDAKIIENISADDLAILARTGAQVLHPNALRFKTDDYQAKIVHFEDLNKIDSISTRINGAVNTEIRAYEGKLTLFTFTGKDVHKKVGLLAKTTQWFATRDTPIHSISSGTSFLSLYVDGDVDKTIYEKLHKEFIEETSIFEGLNRVENIAEIKISNHIFIEQPGVISLIAHNLSKEAINIIEMVTAHTDIVVYVDQKVRDKSIEILERRLFAKD